MSNLARTRDILLIVCLVGVILYLGGSIIFPIIFSFFGALTLLPLVNFFQRNGFNNLFSVLVVVLIVSLIVILIFGFIFFGIYHMITSLGDSQSIDINTFLEGLKKELYSTFDMNSKQAISDVTDNAISASGKWIEYLFSVIKSTIMFLSLTPIYIFFILYYRENFTRFLNQREDHASRKRDIRLIKNVKDMLQKYLTGLLTVMLIVSVLNTISLFAFGIQYPILIGFITGFLIIIPYIGVFLGAAIPITIAFITKDSLFYPIGVLISYLVVQFLEGNYITPKIVGESVNVNPLVIIISILILGALGGILAMIIAVPLVGAIKIYIDHSQHKEFGILISNKVKTEKSLSDWK